jgi:Flp pilus assembly protein TadG
MLFNRKNRKFDAYLKETSGNVAIIAALAIIPILSVLGFAVDWQLVVTKKNAVQHTLDATLIAAARERQGGASADQIGAFTNTQFGALMEANDPGLDCGMVEIGFNEETDAIEANVRCVQPTTLSAIFGRTEVGFQVTTGSVFDSGKLDVAFVFDLSGSMNSGGRLSDLKNAANSALDILLPSDRSIEDEVRVSIATYNHAVNAGPYFDETVDFVTRENSVINSEILGDRYDDLVGRVQLEGTGSNPRRFWSYETSRNRTDFSARFYYDPMCVYDRRGRLNATDDAPDSFSTSDSSNDTFLTVGHPLWDFSPNRTESNSVHIRKRAGEDQIHRRRGDLRLNGNYRPRTNSLRQTNNIQFNGVNGNNTIRSNGAFTNSINLGGGINDSFPLEACRPNNEPIPLTDDVNELRSFVNGMTAGGGTAGHLGVAWGWYLLSPKWSDIWPADSEPFPYDDPEATKAIILMTDGEFNSTHPLDPKSSTELAADYCDNIKRDTSIVIFTVGFRVPSRVDRVARSGQTILEHCASTPAFAFSADNAADLESAYRRIATTISDLRLSQ